MDHEASIRSLPVGEGDSMEPRSMRVNHHRSGRAELSVDKVTGGHMLHLALAACVFANLNRIASEQSVKLAESQVSADGGFSEDGTSSTGVSCRIYIAGEADEKTLAAIARLAFDDSTVAAVLSHGTTVELDGIEARSVPPR